jgi:O-antigen ligase
MALKSILYLFLFILGVFYSFKKPSWGIITFILMTFIRPEKVTYWQLVPFRLPFVISLILLFIFFYRMSRLRELKYEKKFMLFFLLFIMGAYISCFDAVWDVDYSVKFATVLLKIFLFCFLMVKFIQDEQDVERIINAIMIGAGFLAIWGVEQYFRGNVRLEYVGGGNFDESNGLASLYVQILPLFIALFFGAVKYRYSLLIKILSLVMIVFFLAGTVCTESRAAFLGLVLSIGNYLFRKKQFIYIVAIVVLAGAFYFVAKSVPGYMDRIDVENMQEDKGADRLLIWEAAYRIFKENPINGVGQQNFKFIARYYIEGETARSRDSLFDAHNTFILIMVEGGLMQLVPFLVMIFIFYKTTGWLIKNRDKFSDRLLLERVYAIEAGMTAWLITNLFHSQSITENFYWYLCLPLVIKSLIAQQKNEAIYEIAKV